jgi:peroxiredoxin
VFKDNVQTNSEVSDGALDLVFLDGWGEKVDLKQFRGKKHVVLVVTRGFPGYVCPNCTAQTSRLVTNYPQFVRRNAEVFVVFPGPKENVQAFVQESQKQASKDLPFPVLLDEDYQAVEKLGIRADQAKPSTYILDKQGKVRFAYVGKDTTDRPSVKAMLDQLDKL